MRRASRHLLRVFVTGLLAALPLAATVLVFAWGIGLVWRWVGPDSAFGSLMSAIGLGVTGSEIVGYAVGLALIAACILGLGLLIELGLQRGLSRLVDSVVRRIPLVRNVYDLVQRFVGLLSQRDPDGTRRSSDLCGAPSAAATRPAPWCWRCRPPPSRCGWTAAPACRSWCPPHRCRSAAACCSCPRPGWRRQT